jgi:hypothetical protein
VVGVVKYICVYILCMCTYVYIYIHCVCVNSRDGKRNRKDGKFDRQMKDCIYLIKALGMRYIACKDGEGEVSECV